MCLVPISDFKVWLTVWTQGLSLNQNNGRKVAQFGLFLLLGYLVIRSSGFLLNQNILGIRHLAFWSRRPGGAPAGITRLNAQPSPPPARGPRFLIEWDNV